jgi:acetyltransferase-like isoleucine patch superfamily enzyme
VNTGAVVEHDCHLEDHVHIATGARLGGGVTVREQSFIGMGASIRHGITIGARAIVGAGAVVVKDVCDGVTVVGVPAHRLNGSPRSGGGNTGDRRSKRIELLTADGNLKKCTPSRVA